MSLLRSRVRTGTKLAASVGAGLGLAALLSGWSLDGADARSRRDAKRHEAVPSRPLGKPVMAIVSLNQQRVTVYDVDGAMLQAAVSTGMAGYETPAGIFTVLQKQAEHYSNLYDDASMPFMHRLTWSGIALHAGPRPGYPASHGCVRMPFGFAERLFELSKLGMRVIVVRDDIAPADFAHRALFKPLLEDVEIAGQARGTSGEAPTRLAYALASADAPAAGPRRRLQAIAAAKSAAAAAAARTAAEAQKAARSATIEAARANRLLRRAKGAKYRAEQRLARAERRTGGADGAASKAAQQAKAEAEAAVAAAQTRLEEVEAETQPKVDLALELRTRAKEAAAARAAAKDEAKEAARKLSPVSVFISRATQRLYVRQAREQVLEAPVVIADVERPLGTYIFTALAYKDGQRDMRWSVVSMYRSQRAARTRTRRGSHAGAAPADRAGAKAALERIEIPKETAERISALVAPGASLIVSDERLSRETGKATEFIVVMSGEPQGGLRMRPRRSRSPYARYPRPSGSAFGWSGPAFPWWQ